MLESLNLAMFAMPKTRQPKQLQPMNKEISKILINWYRVNKRDLPWRNTRDPYRIWISEIILQQTRVAQGESYYRRFVDRFPDVQTLASASEEEVLKYWQGLGYYTRARNLHAAAKTVCEEYQGLFPTDYKYVRALKGIGDYTAAAIVSFTTGQPYPVVDGNVFRVLARLFAVDTPIDTGKGKKEFTDLARELMDTEQTGIHNQAIMEFGALQCVPQSPDCTVCPLQDRCKAYQFGDVTLFPIKKNKTKTRDRFFHYFDIRKGDKTYLYRRAGKDIWTGLFEFPMIETAGDVSPEALMTSDEFCKLFGESKLSIHPFSKRYKHVLSHQVLYADFYRVEVGDDFTLPEPYREIRSDEISEYAVPQLMNRYLLE